MYSTPSAITVGTLWLIAVVSLIVTGLVIYFATRAAIISAHAAIERDKAEAARHETARSRAEKA